MSWLKPFVEDGDKAESYTPGERGYRRKNLVEWDLRWQKLSVPARRAFLDQVKSPRKESTSTSYYSYSPREVREPPSVAASLFAQSALDELVQEGFVEVRDKTIKGKPVPHVFAVDSVADFLTRIRAIHRYNLLNENSTEFPRYINFVYGTTETSSLIDATLRSAGLICSGRLDEGLSDFVLTHRWPGWVLARLKDPLADQVVAWIRERPAPPGMLELIDRFEKKKRVQARAAIDRLITNLVLVEDFDPRTYNVRVGLVPRVVAAMTRASIPRTRPPLEIINLPREVGPTEGYLVSDLRSLLLEIVSQSPRLRQDGALFAKELDRFESALEPLPSWFEAAQQTDIKGRVESAVAWSRFLKLTVSRSSNTGSVLELSAQGRKWLADSNAGQFATVLGAFTGEPTLHDVSTRSELELFVAGSNLTDFYRVDSDFRFLGSRIAALKSNTSGRGKKPNVAHYDRGLESALATEFQAIRKPLDSLFSELEAGSIYLLESLLDHASFGRDNPLWLGTDPDALQVNVFTNGRLVPPFEEHIDRIARTLIAELVRNRLIPLGGLQAAVDRQGRLCVARLPQLGAYFGRKIKESGTEAAATGESPRVVIQPDFSVVIIGPSPAPAAELMPFCERTGRGGGQGALVLKITRKAVVKAVGQGLAGSEIVARLRRHATVDVPANVLREVAEWAGWVRPCSLETWTVVRCPDDDAADRILSILGKHARKVQKAIVVLDEPKLTTAQRQKLKDQGILLSDARPAAEKGATKAKKRRRSYW